MPAKRTWLPVGYLAGRIRVNGMSSGVIPHHDEELRWGGSSLVVLDQSSRVIFKFSVITSP